MLNKKTPEVRSRLTEDKGKKKTPGEHLGVFVFVTMLSGFSMLFNIILIIFEKGCKKKF